MDEEERRLLLASFIPWSKPYHSSTLPVWCMLYVHTSTARWFSFNCQEDNHPTGVSKNHPTRLGLAQSAFSARFDQTLGAVLQNVETQPEYTSSNMTTYKAKDIRIST